jgi:hypothetical protein
MKSALLVLVASLAIISSVAASQKAPLKGATDTKAFFTEIDKHHFGSSLIGLLAIHTAAGSPIDELDVLLA